MPPGTETRESISKLISELKESRTNLVDVRLKMSKLEGRIITTKLEMRRIESMLILAVSREILADGRPAYTDEWVKKALVEERLAKHERFCKLLKKHGLLQKQLARKVKDLSLTQVKVDELESEERLLLAHH